MSLHIRTIIFLMLILAAASVLNAADKDPVIKVIAEGSAAVSGSDIAKAEDEALGDARRNAVEKALGVFVQTDAMGSDYQVVQKTILTRSEGYISDWHVVDGSKKIERVQGYDLLKIQIEASVKLTSLLNDATDIGPIYNAMQRPRIMVLISDELESKSGETSSCATAAMKALKERGFDVVDLETFRKQKNCLSESLKNASDFAISQGADILILGSAKTVEGPTDNSGNIKTSGSTLDTRVVYSDTAQVLFTPKQIQGRGAAFGDRKEACFRALNDAGKKLIQGDSQSFVTQLLAAWALELQSGRIYKITAENIATKDLDGFKNAIEDIRGFVGFVGEVSYSERQAVLNVRNKLSPEQFRLRLASVKIGKKPVEVCKAGGRSATIRLK